MKVDSWGDLPLLEWISENIADIVVCALLLAAVIFAVASMVRDKKKGNSRCGGSCSGCPLSGSCDREKDEGDNAEL